MEAGTASRSGLVNPAFTRFPFPPQWHFDVLRGLEHFRAAGAAADPRLGDAIDVIRRDGVRMGHGRCTGLTPAGRGFGWNRPDPAVGRPCEPFGSSSGGIRRSRPALWVGSPVPSRQLRFIG